MFVQYNRRLRERFQKRKNHPQKYDPICLPDLDWGSEWMTQNFKNFVRDDDNFTWTDVELTMGASYERPTRSRTQPENDDDDDWLEEESDEDEDDTPWKSDKIDQLRRR